jgi:hypothetical protein
MATIRALTNYRLRSYVLRDGDAWVGHCLPLGVVVQGDSLIGAVALLAECAQETVANLVERGVNPLTAFGPPSDESIAEFESLKARPQTMISSLEEAAQDNLPSAIFDLLLPMPPQSELPPWATLAKPYDSLSVPSAVAC